MNEGGTDAKRRLVFSNVRLYLQLTAVSVDPMSIQPRHLEDGFSGGYVDIEKVLEALFPGRFQMDQEKAPNCFGVRCPARLGFKQLFSTVETVIRYGFDGAQELFE